MITSRTILWVTIFAVLSPFSRVATADAFFTRTLEPLLKEYCFDCHADGETKGEFSLDHLMNPESFITHAGEWEGIMVNIDRYTMPPGKRKKPSPVQREEVVTWLRDKLFPVDCSKPNPGRVTIRRLNRTEYNNVIRDLFGVSIRPADEFPADDTGYGFDTVGDVLSVSALQWEKYMQAADKVLEQIFPSRPKPPARVELKISDLKGHGGPSSQGRVLASNGTTTGRLSIKEPGRYRFTLTVSADQAGGEKAKGEWQLAKNPVMGFEVTGKDKEDSNEIVNEMTMEAGNVDVALRFINDFYDPKVGDRNLHIHSLLAEGPLDRPVPPPTDAYLALLRHGALQSSSSAKAREVVKHIARLAWRRTPHVDEIDRLMAFYDMAHSQGENFHESLRLALQATLISPHFLFRGEASPPGTSKPTRIGEVELASRLSFFLWSSIPDDELLKMAEAGRLRKNLPAVVDRMLRDAKSSALSENFAGQWLQIRKLAALEPDPNVFPEWDEELRSAAMHETGLFFHQLIMGNLPITDLLTANYTYVNERLAKFYGIPGITGTVFTRAEHTDPRRRGILTHASVLTITSNPTRTSPVHRGKYVLETILDAPPPPAPQNIPELGEARDAGPDATLRRRLEIHRDHPACSTCHAIMDPPGFAFEHYNAIGLWRDLDEGQPVDARGELVTGDTFQGHMEFIDWLVAERREQFIRAIAKNMMTYALGRGVEHYDRCTLDDIVKRTSKDGHRMKTLVMAIIESAPFQYRAPQAAREASLSLIP